MAELRDLVDTIASSAWSSRPVRYWTGDVSDDETDAIEEHVFGCAACFEASS